MQTADANSLDWVILANPRSDNQDVYLQFKQLLRGTEGSPQNFELTLAQSIGGDPPSPRHRHNFDQLRVGLSGRYGYLPDGDLLPGTMVYLPEGAYYGPESAEGDPIILSLQFGGANGDGFMSMAQMQAASNRLREHGSFEAGKYLRTDDKGEAVEQDGYEAVWEEAMGAPVTYPEPRYAEPIGISPETFGWETVSAGVSKRHLGTFTERRLELSILRVEDGAAHEEDAAGRPRVLFVLDGALRVNGYEAAANHAIHLGPDEAATLEGAPAGQSLVVDLPRFP